MSSLCSTASRRNSNMTLARVVRALSFQLSNAALAAATASSTTSAEAKATSACTCPDAGSNTGPVRSGVPSQGLPLIQWLISFTVSSGSLRA